MKMKGMCTGPKYEAKKLGRWRKRHMGGHDMVRRMDRQAEVLIWVWEMLWFWATKNGTQIDELLQAGASEHKRVWNHVETNSGS